LIEPDEVRIAKLLAVFNELSNDDKDLILTISETITKQVCASSAADSHIVGRSV
jgi:hypothetical protein